jgi:hypothetical protein
VGLTAEHVADLVAWRARLPRADAREADDA